MRTTLILQQVPLLLCGLRVAISPPMPSQQPQHAKELLHLSYLASGGTSWAPLAQVEMTGKLNTGGLKGSFREIVDLKNGRDVTDMNAGPLSTKEATLTDSSWQIDQSGVVTYSDTPSEKISAINQSFQDRNGWFTAPLSELAYDGIRQDQGTSYDLVTVTPVGGRSITLWLNVQNHLLYRIDQQDSAHHKNSTYLSDYRRIDGVMMPFCVRQSNGDASQDTVETIDSMQLSPTLDQAVFIAPHSTFNDARLAGGQGSAAVPFTMTDGLIVVNVSINGHSPVPFLLDSGGSNYMTPEAAKRLGVKGAGNIRLSGSGKKQDNAQLAKVGEVRLGAVRMLHQVFVLGPLPEELEHRGTEAPIAGLVGAELLRCFPTTFNYQKRILTFYTPGTVPPEPRNAQTLRLYFSSGHPFIQVAVDDAPGIFGIDTGDDSTTTIFGAFYRQHKFPVEQPTLSASQGGGGGMGAAQVTRIGSLGFGSWKLETPVVTLNFAEEGAFSPDSIAGNLGSEVLKNFVFTLDYEHRKGYFVQSSEFGTPIVYIRSGMALKHASDGKVLVERVNPDMPAEKAGIRVGDVVLSLNGKTPNNTLPSVFDKVLSEKADTEIDVRYARNGKEMNARFRLVEILPRNGLMKPLDLDLPGK
jgi:hypothetical protein